MEFCSKVVDSSHFSADRFNEETDQGATLQPDTVER